MSSSNKSSNIYLIYTDKENATPLLAVLQFKLNKVVNGSKKKRREKKIKRHQDIDQKENIIKFIMCPAE